MRSSVVWFAMVLAIITGCASHQEQSHTIQAPPLPPLTSPGTKFAILPSAVQRTIVACGGTAEIKDINKAAGRDDVYEVQFSNPAGNPTLFIREDGTPLNGSKSGLPPASLDVALPPPVRWALEKEAPNAVVTNIEPSELTLYEISLADTNASASTNSPKVLILEDGRVLHSP